MGFVNLELMNHSDIFYEETLNKQYITAQNRCQYCIVLLYTVNLRYIFVSSVFPFYFNRNRRETIYSFR